MMYQTLSFEDIMGSIWKNPFVFPNDEMNALLSEQVSDDYIHKGLRLENLAKDKFNSMLHGFDFSEVEQKVIKLNYSGCINFDKLIQLISTKIILPLFRVMKNKDDESASALKSLIKGKYSVEFLLDGLNDGCVCLGDERENIRIRPRNVKKGETEFLGIKLFQDGNEILRTFGLKNSHHGKKYSNSIFRTADLTICDVSILFAQIVVLSWVSEQLDNPDSDIILSMREKKAGEAIPYFGYTFLDRDDKPEEQFRKKWYVCLDPDRENQFIPFLDYLYQRYGVSYELCDWNTFSIGTREASEKYRNCSPEERGELPLFISASGLVKLLDHDFYEYIYHLHLNNQENPIMYSNLRDRHVSNKKTYFFPLLSVNSVFACHMKKVCFEVFLSLMEKDLDDIKSACYYKEQTGQSAHARSYQTMSYHTEKTIKAMKESKFNSFFGFVELDDDVDLNKVDIVCEQFLAWQTEYLPLVDGSCNSIRFRKLGNHKASGLYYPYVKCLCVDYRMCTSFIHEFGHLLDYTYGNLSHKTEFSKIKKLFKEHLQATEKDITFTPKYDMDYYSEPTEIFARSFELYNSYVLGVDNSLLPEKGSFSAVYPKETNTVFFTELKNYFDNLFCELSETEEKIAV